MFLDTNPIGERGSKRPSWSRFLPSTHPILPVSLSICLSLSPPTTHTHIYTDSLYMHGLLPSQNFCSLLYNFLNNPSVFQEMDIWKSLKFPIEKKKNYTKSIMNDALANLKVFPLRKLVTVNMFQWSCETCDCWIKVQKRGSADVSKPLYKEINSS